MSAHAVLSPSSASRWLECTPSARLEKQFAETPSEAAKEGTLAHSLGELIIRYCTETTTVQKYIFELKRIEEHTLYDTAMFDYIYNYAVFVLERYVDARTRSKDAILYLEQQLNLTEYVPEGFGTGDAVVIADGVLDIIDLKYGKGVPVAAFENKQMMLYSLGALREFGFLFEISTIRMTIFQPRLDNISTYEMTVSDLLEWGETELRPKAKLAFDGKGEFIAGAHCRFCKAAALCRANAAMNLEVAKYDFSKPELLNDEETADILKRADLYRKWITSVEEHALNEALNSGKRYPGFKLVEGRSNRIYSDETLVGEVLQNHEYKEDVIYTKKLVGITALEKFLGKDTFNKILSGLIIKPPGKPALVSVDDKRPEYNSPESAVTDFKN